jgi:hypothetical protein
MVLDLLIKSIKSPLSLKGIIFLLAFFSMKDSSILIISAYVENKEIGSAIIYQMTFVSFLIGIGIISYYFCSKIYKKYVKENNNL